jgi:hypothetical protein
MSTMLKNLYTFNLFNNAMSNKRITYLPIAEWGMINQEGCVTV